MKDAPVVLSPIVMLLALTGCNMEPPSAKGISLPEGDAVRGQETFVTLQCTTCHDVRGLELPEPETEGPVTVVVGGGVTRVRTYGELVTSIINPSHRLARGFPADRVSREGESLMVVYNDIMTVSELIDLVAFLRSRYEKIERPGYRYPVYDYEAAR